MLERGLLPAIATVLLASPAAAEDREREKPFSVEFRAGVEYDSNVAVLELDASSGEPDVSALIDFGVGFDKRLTERLSVNLGYDYSQSLHEQFEEFDLGLHRGSAGFGFDHDGLEAGATLQYADAALDDQGYLVLAQATPYLSKLVRQRALLRLACALTDKEFSTSPERDARSVAPSIDAYVFAGGLRSFVTIGGQYQDEDAVDDRFDYAGPRLKLQLSHRAGHPAHEVHFKAGLRYESRDYGGPLLSDGRPRRDERWRLDAELEAALSRHVFFRAAYEYADNRSNLPSVDFDEHVASLTLGARL
jgi:opacity protein-like surface antigen